MQNKKPPSWIGDAAPHPRAGSAALWGGRPNPSPARPIHELLGRTVAGRYRIDQILGDGGMAVVFLAYHLQLRRSVALKVLKAKFCGDPASIERFKREAQAAAAISSRHIVRVLDVGDVANNTVYIAMEYLRGRDLERTLLEATKVDWARARPWFIQISRGLGAVHRHGIVHRDIKPSNCMITTDERGEELIKILDFGIAKLALSASQAALTETGAIFGTAKYMSPEQARGSATIDHRSDLYSVGVMLFETLSGQVPFDGDSFMQIANKHRHEPIPSLKRLRSDLPQIEELDALLNRALQKHPEQRFASMQEFEAALEAIDPMANPNKPKNPENKAQKAPEGTLVLEDGGLPPEILERLAQLRQQGAKPSAFASEPTAPQPPRPEAPRLNFDNPSDPAPEAPVPAIEPLPQPARPEVPRLNFDSPPASAAQTPVPVGTAVLPPLVSDPAPPSPSQPTSQPASQPPSQMDPSGASAPKGFIQAPAPVPNPQFPLSTPQPENPAKPLSDAAPGSAAAQGFGPVAAPNGTLVLPPPEAVQRSAAAKDPAKPTASPRHADPRALLSNQPGAPATTPAPASATPGSPAVPEGTMLMQGHGGDTLCPGLVAPPAHSTPRSKAPPSSLGASPGPTSASAPGRPAPVPTFGQDVPLEARSGVQDEAATLFSPSSSELQIPLPGQNQFQNQFQDQDLPQNQEAPRYWEQNPPAEASNFAPVLRIAAMFAGALVLLAIPTVLFFVDTSEFFEASSRRDASSEKAGAPTRLPAAPADDSPPQATPAGVKQAGLGAEPAADPDSAKRAADGDSAPKAAAAPTEHPAGAKDPAKRDIANNRPKTLSPEAILGSLRPVRKNVKRCGEPGVVKVALRIAPNGRVISARALDAYKSTPTGRCVVAAVKKAKFPAIQSRKATLTHQAFDLRP